MKSNGENNLYLDNDFNNNEDINYNLKKNNLFTDSDNDEFFKKNNDIKNLINKNENNNISNTMKSKVKDIQKTRTDVFRMNYNNHDNTIPISKKTQKSEIQNIDKILRFFKKENDSYISKNNFFNNEKIINTIENIEELENQKEILTQKLKKIKLKNKELMSYVEPYKQSMTNEDIENEERLKYIKYLDDKLKERVLINNKLKQKLMTNQNINIKKKIEYLINKQIKEYEKLYNDDLNMNENFNEIKYKNNYTNNNVDVKCELSLSGANSEYKMNNVTTDGFVNSKHKNKISGNLKVNNKNTNIFKLNKNNSLVFCGDEKNKNNNSLKPKRNNSKTNFLSSIKYIKNSKITRNNNTSSSITSSHDNNNKNNINKKNDFKSMKQNSKITNATNFKIK